MTIKLDGTQVPGQNIMVHLTAERNSQDMSGGTSSTDTTELGTKAKVINVQLLIPFSSPDLLGQLNELSERKNAEETEAHTYRVTNDVANQLGVNHAQFFDDLVVSEQEARMVWQVTFSLRERLSVQERIERREAAEAAQRSQESSAAPEEVPADVELSDLERLMAYIDDRIGDIVFGDDDETT